MYYYHYHPINYNYLMFHSNIIGQTYIYNHRFGLGHNKPPQSTQPVTNPTTSPTSPTQNPWAGSGDPLGWGSGGGGGASGFPGGGGESVGTGSSDSSASGSQGGTIKSTAPPGKKGFENKLFEIARKEPYTYECWWEKLGVKTKGICTGTKRKVTGFYFGFNYPDSATTSEESTIWSCAGTAAEAAKKVFGALIASGNLYAALAAVPSANETFKTTLRQCLEKANMPIHIIRGTTGGIYTKRLD